MNRNIQLLTSIRQGEKVKNMTEQQNDQFATNIKRQSTYFFFNANRAIEGRDFERAKRILIYLADASSCVRNPDAQVQQVLQICCEYLAVIRRKQLQKKNRQTMYALDRGPKKKVTNLVVLKYNKFSGGFQFDQGQKKRNKTNKDLLFYIGQLNEILFSTQNSQNHHSMMAMFKAFPLAFILSFILIVCSCAFYFSKYLGQFLTDNDQLSLIFKISQFSLVASFIIPLIMIVWKKPFQKDSNFFKTKLGEKIENINKECAKLQKNIVFFMPEGIQINVKVQQSQLDVDSQDQSFQIPQFELRK